MLLLVVFSLPCQRTAKESSKNAATLYSTVGLRSNMHTRNTPEAPELETPRYKGKNVGSNGVRYRGVLL